MPEHIAHARDVCAQAGIPNVSLHHALFGAPELRALPQFDYVVAHGVYSWISAAARGEMRAFIDRHLKPGGLVYLSYNAMPGWAADLPLQWLLRELAASGAGDSSERFDSAAGTVQRMTDAGARALLASPLARSGLEERRKTTAAAYFPHEFLPAAFQPRYVTEVRAEFAEVGLEPVGSAVIRDNFDSYTIGQRGRDVLATVGEPTLREQLRDYFRATRFRRDVFGRELRVLDDETRRTRLGSMTYHLAAPPERVTFRMTTAAGEVRYDTPAAHHIVDALAGGPRRLADLADSRFPFGDLLATAMALCSAGDVRPVSRDPVPVEDVNALLHRRLDRSPAFPYHVSPYGTAIRVTPDADWTAFLRVHGMEVPARQ